jgi:exopolysaccharide biosynthesis polyprenyl glycosylphosphotransferase
LLAFASFALQLEFSRGLVLVSVPMLVGTTLGTRYALRRHLAARRSAGDCLRPTVLVGNARAVAETAERIARDPQTNGLYVAGACVDDPEDPALGTLASASIPTLGAEADTLQAVDLVGAEVVAVASSPTMSGQALRRLGWALEQRDVDLLIAPGIVEVAGPRLSLRPSSGLSMLHVERPVSSGLRYRLKMALDRLIALFALIVFSPLLFVIALLIRYDSRGPALFRQHRVGEAGQVFPIVKFRTMVVDADARVKALADRTDGNGVLFKMHRDPRVTRVGRFLRRYSIDELPQLINVVRGEMSLVGPRPPLPREVDGYESDAVRRLRVRPGMTGLWQVSGRSDLSWGDSVRLDLWYVDNWSLALDTQILVRTVKAVVNGSGAY